jgi:hypothetical protein
MSAVSGTPVASQPETPKPDGKRIEEDVRDLRFSDEARKYMPELTDRQAAFVDWLVHR